MMRRSTRKEAAIQSGWKKIEEETLVKTPHLQVTRERIATPTRPKGVEWFVARRKQAVVIAPRTPEGKFVLVYQERVPLQAMLWEFPAGQIDGPLTPEHILETAHRELGEEAGLQVQGELIPLGGFYSSAGFTDEYAHLFLATDTIPSKGEHKLDHDEAILEVRAFSLAELQTMVAEDEICDANTLALLARLWATKEWESTESRS